MKYFTVIVLGICLSVSSYCQVIKGTILDKSTGKPISYASVYFDGSTVGTVPDQNGCFKINNSKHLSVPLIISALGYYSYTLSNPCEEITYEISLTPKTYNLSEVIIISKSTWKERRQRKKNFELFRQQFLGNSMNAKKCEILNEEDLFFKKSSSSDETGKATGLNNSGYDTLLAYSYNPLIIINKALGYKITFFLDRFEFYFSPSKSLLVKDEGFAIDGHAFFEQLEKQDEKKIARFEIKRKSAFLGSRMHFLRSLYDNSIDSSGFSIEGFAKNNSHAAPIVISKASISPANVAKCLRCCGGGFFISYYSKRPSSFVMLNGCELLFNRSTILNPDDMAWGGEMADQRIGDLLPDDYEYK